MADLLSVAVADINRTLRRSAVLELALGIVRAVLLSFAMLTIWTVVKPDAELEQLSLTLLTLALALAMLRRRRTTTVRVEDLALALEIDHPETPTTAMSLLRTNSTDGAIASTIEPWASPIAAQVSDLKHNEARRLWRYASTLVLPLVVIFVTLPKAAPSLSIALIEVGNAVKRLSQGATLKIVQGAVKDGDADKVLALKAGAPVSIDLLAQNLIEINVAGIGQKVSPTVELKRQTTDAGKDTVFQSFQMSPVRGNGENSDDVDHYTISFAVSEPVELFIPELSKNSVATLKVQQLPIPKVNLSVTSEPEDPWPDDQPLGLKIKVSAENPLQFVRLIIRSGQRVSKELVANVMTEDKKELTTDYRLILETYVESDLADVEIIAEAVDRSVPTPLVGQSEPLKLKTASAYGRYREALQTLRSIKKILDDAQTKEQKSLPIEAGTLAAKATIQSEKSPFFDGLDRVTIHRFKTRIDELSTQSSSDSLFGLSNELNNFLFEHEILDDRERDRDFFVATRAMSRLIEQDPAKRPVSIKTVAGRLHKFLDDRLERWTKRVARLPEETVPQKWQDVKRQSFQKEIDSIQNAEQAAENSGSSDAKTRQKVTATQLETLSKTVIAYRAWIEDLEAKEDQSREKEETERQQGLASARNTLRELQLRQGKITQNLDRSSERQKAELEAIWPATHMEQNANVKETRRLENQMRSLAPNAGARIEAAIEAMEATNEDGESGNFVAAESNSDMAGRLLRQAERDTQESQQKRRDRGRRRRVTGDNYYGQSVVGGDVEIKREYEVDRRYREDVLDEIQNSSYDDEQRTLLENYLRHVVR